MPTTTFNIMANADDGWGGIYHAPVANANYGFIAWYPIGTIDSKYGSWLRFTGITIPQNSTINSATIKAYMIGQPGATTVSIKADGRLSPGNPTLGTQCTNPTPIIGTIVHTGIGTTSTGGIYTKTSYNLNNIDVTSFVQALVNTYNYSNSEMVFYFNEATLRTSNNKVAIYQRDWGTTEAAKLEVDYTVRILANKTTYEFE